MSVELDRLIRELDVRHVRYALIGVAGANHYALGASMTFQTRDQDLFLPPDPANLVEAWNACEHVGLELTCSGEPLDRPRDTWLAERIVGMRALTRATDGKDLLIDLTLVMAGFEFDEVWRERREFLVEGATLHVARLTHIVRSKTLANRPKDRLFLETHSAELRELLGRGERDARR